jgi:hypothetical protein
VSEASEHIQYVLELLNTVAPGFHRGDGCHSFLQLQGEGGGICSECGEMSYSPDRAGIEIEN